MIRRFVRRGTRVSTALLAIAMPLAPASIAAQQAGAEFDVKTVISVSGGMSAALAGMAPGYSGHGVRPRKSACGSTSSNGGAAAARREGRLHALRFRPGLPWCTRAKRNSCPFRSTSPNKAIEQMQVDGHERSRSPTWRSSPLRHASRSPTRSPDIPRATTGRQSATPCHARRHGHEPTDEKPGDERVLDGDGPRTRPESAAASRPARRRQQRSDHERVAAVQGTGGENRLRSRGT